MKRHKMFANFLKNQLLDIIAKRLRYRTLINLNYSPNCHYRNHHHHFNSHQSHRSNNYNYSSYSYYHHNSLVSYNSWWYLLIIMVAINVSNHSTVNALRCYCNPHECDVIRSQDCPGKGFTVWDPCKCCRMCARTLGEACGGPGGFSGTCEPPLQCVAQLPLVDGLGVCTDLPETASTTILNCTNEETIELDAGCEIANNKCLCWPLLKICKDDRPSNGRWHFKTLEDCQLNLQNLIKTEMEFDEDFTVSPRSFTYRKVRGKRRRVRRRYLRI